MTEPPIANRRSHIACRTRASSFIRSLLLLAFLGLAAILVGADRFDCKSKVEVGLMCDPTLDAPVKFGLTDLVNAMRTAHLIPNYVRPDSRKTEARYLLVVGTTGRNPWLAPYLAAAKLTVPNTPESFAIGDYSRRDRRTVVLAGSDAVGTMYGLFELTELLASNQLDPQKPFKRLSKSPFLGVRGVNVTLSLPMPGESEWWFHSQDFWRGYLDLLARSRINFIDLQGMYDIVKTTFTNAYPYFVKSRKYPQSTDPRVDATRNLAMLNTVTTWAKERGIRVGLMTQSNALRLPPGSPLIRRSSEDVIADYTREAVAKILRDCPNLAMLGLCIGESGRTQDLFRKGYNPALAEAGRPVDFYAPASGAGLNEICDIARATQSHLDVEIKYNGDHLGAPYIVTGGRMAAWPEYSYRTYLGVPHPYRVLWQIRAGGTHRIFHWGDPTFVKRAVEAATLGGAVGLVVEPLGAYQPPKDYFHSHHVHHDFFTWFYERSWFWHMLWGRLAYDPETPVSAWNVKFTERFGPKGGPRVLDIVCQMSQIIPLIYQAYCLGPNCRDMAPELETGGDLQQFAQGQPLDPFVMQSVNEFVTRHLLNKPTAKISPLTVADSLERISKHVLQRVETARKEMEAAGAAVTDKGRKEFDCIALDAEALAHLAQYYADKLRAAVAYAFFEATNDISRLDISERLASQAREAWRRLAAVTGRHYRPFLDTRRMHSVAFHWQTETAKLEKDAQVIAEARKRFEESVPGEDSIFIAHTPPRRAFTGKGFDITVTLATRAKFVYAVLYYRQGTSDAFNSTRLLRTKTSPYCYATHVGSTWTPGRRIDYYIEVTYGKKFARYPVRGKDDPISVLITDDKSGPQITLQETTLKDAAPGKKELTVSVRVSDKSRVERVLLWHKPLPSEADWRYTPMQEQAGQHVVARVPVTHHGLLYAVEALDDAGNGTRYPDVSVDRPYLVVEPWPLATPEEPDQTGFQQIARRDLSPERYSAMLIGAQAKTFNAQPPEVKRFILDRVAEGLSLVIFYQEAGGGFDFTWLPGKINVNSEVHRACKLVGAAPLLDGVQRDMRNMKIIGALTSGDKEWKHYSEPKALALCKHGKGVIILCQARNLDTLHNVMAFRLFANTLKVAASDRLGKPFVALDLGNEKLAQALELAGQPYVALNDVPLLVQERALSSPAPAETDVAPAKPRPAASPTQPATKSRKTP